MIQLPGVPPPTSDARLSANPADWRVELIVGKEMTADCNGPRLNGMTRRETLKGWGYQIYGAAAGVQALTLQRVEGFHHGQAGGRAEKAGGLGLGLGLVKARRCWR